MDQEIRNKLRNVVTQCRKLLEDSVSQELEGKYGIFAKKDKVTADPNATMTHLTEEEQAARNDILDHFGHIKARGFKPKEALDQLVREIAFTHLNRLCAYKMMEAREVYVGGQKFREAVSRGINSNGVKFYLADNPEEERLFNTGHQDVAYRHFLDWLGGLLSDEIGVLFSPDDPANRLYPRQKTLDEVLDLLNGGGIKAEETGLPEEWPKIWSQDETIGWVYQYFTPKELRDQARKESAAPRNSYELAFRNQFFTPRYVVEFLTGNTLGRIWYEMRKGDTKIKDQCRYLVRRPTELFLRDGEQVPKDTAEGRDDLSQEELLKLPVYIPHRAKKDPRELKILDPACGSGHFLLYCFDLLLTIYEEAYADPELGPVLHKDYPTLEDLRRDVPRLILAHNLHGIDIDLRCSQIAALALWLRCQRAYQEMGLKKDRSRITRSNFACAEPMPGEVQMLKEFVNQLEPKLLGQVVEVVFDKMKLAGEAGSLLKIEEEIRDAVAAAKKQWVRETTKAIDRKGQPLLFTQVEMARLSREPEQPSLFDLTDITDDQFFERAEVEVKEALRQYAEKAQSGQRLQRRLFAEDAERGFGFVDLCHKRYDVVLMNPPFGESSKPAKAIIEKQYPRTKNDLYAAFVEQGLHRLHRGGLLGAITSRTGFFLSSFQKWREEILLTEATPTALADLGYGVLDTAMVETSAYCVEARLRSNRTWFFRLLQTESKEKALRTSIDTLLSGGRAANVFHVDPVLFRKVPGSPFAYWVSKRIRRLFTDLTSFEANDRTVRIGMKTGDDFRFLRAWWETCPSASRWIPYAKGGPTSHYYSDLPLVVNWADDGHEVKCFVSERMQEMFGNSSWEFWISNSSFYFQPGLTWPLRASRFSPSALPSGAIFSVRGYAIIASRPDLRILCGLCNSTVFDFLFKIMLGRFGYPEFIVGTLRQLPVPTLSNPNGEALGDLAEQCIILRRSVETATETGRAFSLPSSLQVEGETLCKRFESWRDRLCRNERQLAYYQREIDDISFQLYAIDSEDRLTIEEALIAPLPAENEKTSGSEEEETQAHVITDLKTFTEEHISYTLGCSFGRWDVRTIGPNHQRPELADPFDPLPICSPGMLQSAEGVSATRTLEGYPLHIYWDGVLVDDENHSGDIVRQVRAILEVFWHEQTDAIEKEVCEILGFTGLRDYFRKPGKGGFWDDHIARYSKSRRKAPIYWLLQSAKKNYALWLYYHRLDKDLLFKALVNYVEPKIRLEASRLETLRSQKAAAGESGKEAKRLAKDVERQEDFLSELRDFEDKLHRAANLHLEPDLNDGVVLNIAPLWELVPWKEAKNYWDELLEGKYEWSSIGKQLRQKGLVK